MGYVVTWTIDLDADSPREAAQAAFDMLQKPGCTCNCFEVFDADTHKMTFIDLEQENEEE